MSAEFSTCWVLGIAILNGAGLCTASNSLRDRPEDWARCPDTHLPENNLGCLDLG